MDLDQVDPVIISAYNYLDYAGVLLMGVIGGTIARQRGYDIVGFLFIALVSALGGGMMRDVLINDAVVAAMTEPAYLILAFLGAVIARYTYFKGNTWEIIRSHGDALISALWASVGSFKAIAFGLPVLPTIFMGVITATGGSMLRDVLTGREPAVFGDNQPTVVPAIAGSVVTLIAVNTDHLAAGAILGPITSFGLFLLFFYTDWKMPTTSDFTPVNDTVDHVAAIAQKAGRKTRDVARDLEPLRVRTWRHEQMRRALARRIERQVDRGSLREDAEHDASEVASEVIDTFTDQFEDVDPKEVGFDLHGTSYDGSNRDKLDSILSDDALTDELFERLAKRQAEKKNDSETKDD